MLCLSFSVPLHLIPFSESRGTRASPLIPGALIPERRLHPHSPDSTRTHPGQSLLFVQGSLSFDGGVPGTVGEKGTAWKGEKWGALREKEVAHPSSQQHNPNGQKVEASQVSSMDKWINTMGSIHTLEYRSA